MMASKSHKLNHIAVIDPAKASPELDCFNRIAQQSPGPLSYHLPALYGFDSLEERRDGIIGIIILGSRASVHDEDPWQKRLADFLKESWSKAIPTLGICFGHQLIAHILGGKVEYLPYKHKGLRTVELLDNPLWGKGRSGPLVVSHQEVVTQCPASCRVAARSKDIAIDGMAHSDLPIWSFQPHPEATRLFLKGLEVILPPGEESRDPFSFGHSLVTSFVDHVWK